MSTVAWVGPGGNWSDGSSWIGGKVPAPGDTALLTGTPSIKDFNIDGVTIDKIGRAHV